MDAITLLKNDHKTVSKLFREFDRLGDDAAQQKRTVVDEIVKELSVHAFIEETVFYPTAREAAPDTEDQVLESLEEHHIVKWVCAELMDLSPDDEHFDAKVTVLKENVKHHVDEEEHEFFPEVREAMGRKRLAELGEQLEAAKAQAPTSPQPQHTANRVGER